MTTETTTEITETTPYVKFADIPFSELPKGLKRIRIEELNATNKEIINFIKNETHQWKIEQ